LEKRKKGIRKRGQKKEKRKKGSEKGVRKRKRGQVPFSRGFRLFDFYVDKKVKKSRIKEDMKATTIKIKTNYRVVTNTLLFSVAD
jgi:hypothetical protein